MFDKRDLLYFPGDFISGRVLVELERDTLIDGVFFHVLGEGTVRVKQRKKRRRQVDKENYIDFKMRLLGEPGQPATLLSAGIHSFPFKLGLPLGLPSTFLGGHGWVQYVCRAALRQQSGLVHKNHQVFIVLSPIDLNVEPNVLTPVISELDHRLGSSGGCRGIGCCGCTGGGRGGPVFCQVRLDRSGFIPGETISIHAIIDNRSRTAIRRTRAELVETIQYSSACGEVALERRVLSRVTRGKVNAGHYYEWVDEKLPVPALPPTNLRGCHLIQVQYEVEFTLKPPGFGGSARLQLPVIIATYPYRYEDGSIHASADSRLPRNLPVCRPWLNIKYRSLVPE